MPPTVSASVATTVVTAVLPSATLTVPVAPPPSLVMSGAVSLRSFTVMLSVCASTLMPSVASTTTS